MGSGRGEANLVMKCKFCKCESSAGKLPQSKQPCNLFRIAHTY